MMKTNLTKIIAQNIKNERIKQNLSQEKLAELAGVHRTYIGIVERAERNVTVISLEKIARALQVDIKDLFNDY